MAAMDELAERLASLGTPPPTAQPSEASLVTPVGADIHSTSAGQPSDASPVTPLSATSTNFEDLDADLNEFICADGIFQEVRSSIRHVGKKEAELYRSKFGYSPMIEASLLAHDLENSSNRVGRAILALAVEESGVPEDPIFTSSSNQVLRRLADAIQDAANSESSHIIAWLRYVLEALGEQPDEYQMKGLNLALTREQSCSILGSLLGLKLRNSPEDTADILRNSKAFCDVDVHYEISSFKLKLSSPVLGDTYIPYEAEKALTIEDVNAFLYFRAKTITQYKLGPNCGLFLFFIWVAKKKHDHPAVLCWAWSNRIYYSDRIRHALRAPQSRAMLALVIEGWRCFYNISKHREYWPVDGSLLRRFDHYMRTGQGDWSTPQKLSACSRRVLEVQADVEAMTLLDLLDEWSPRYCALLTGKEGLADKYVDSRYRHRLGHDGWQSEEWWGEG